MPNLTRRKFLTGAPTVVAGVAVGAVVALKVRESVSAPRMWVFSESAIETHYWNNAPTEYINMTPKAPYFIYPEDITGFEPLLG